MYVIIYFHVIILNQIKYGCFFEFSEHNPIFAQLKILDIENGTSEIKKGFSKFRTLTKSCYVDNYIHFVDDIPSIHGSRVEHHAWNIHTNEMIQFYVFNELHGHLDETILLFVPSKQMILMIGGMIYRDSHFYESYSDYSNCILKKLLEYGNFVSKHKNGINCLILIIKMLVPHYHQMKIM